METVAYLDTHIAIITYSGNLELLSEEAKKAIETYNLLLSPISILELEYLYEIKKLLVRSQTIVNALINKIGLTICDLSLHDYVNKAVDIKWTRDPFDRLITAGAMIRKAHLITKDKNILKHYTHAIW